MTAARTEALLDRARSGDDDALLALLEAVQPVSYTHLTLPTTPYV